MTAIAIRLGKWPSEVLAASETDVALVRAKMLAEQKRMER